MSLTDLPAHDAADTSLETPPAAPSLLARAGAEVLGTFILVLLGAGAAIFTSLLAPSGSVLTTCLAFGLGATAALVVVGHVSGGHVNPAVTLGAALAGRLRWVDVPVYWVAQVLGATLAGAVLLAVVPGSLAAALGRESSAAVYSAGANGYGVNVGLGAASAGAVEITLQSALIVELVCTLVLVAVVLAVTSPRATSSLTPLWVGVALAGTLLVATPFTGGSVNPARSLGIAFFAEPWAMQQVWVFVAAPLAGAVLAGLGARIASFGASPLALEDAPAPFVDEVVVADELVAESAPVVDDDAAPAAEGAAERAAVEDEDGTPARP